MTFEPGSKVRVNEGLLEGQTGTVTESNDHLTLVKIDDVAFGGGDLVFYTVTLVSAEEDHPALKALKLYPDRLKGDYKFRLTTFIDGVLYMSYPMNGEMVKSVLKNPPAGLNEVEYASREEFRDGVWKLLWES